MKKDKKKKLWIIFGTIIMLLPIACYCLKFRSHSISDNPVDWGVFGDYIGGIYGCLITVLAIYISYRLDQSRDKKSRLKTIAEEFNILIEKLHLNNYNLHTCNTFLAKVGSARMYLSDRQFDLFEVLANHYITQKSQNQPIDKELENKVLRELKNIYES